MSLIESKVIDSLTVKDESNKRSKSKFVTMPTMQSTDDPTTDPYTREKMLHVALYERRIAKFSQKYGLHLNSFMKKKKREASNKSIQTNQNL